MLLLLRTTADDLRRARPATFDLGEWEEQHATRNHDWHRIIDTAPWAEAEGNCWTMDDALHVTGEYTVEPWSIVVLQAPPARPPTTIAPVSTSTANPARFGRGGTGDRSGAAGQLLGGAGGTGIDEVGGRT